MLAIDFGTSNSLVGAWIDGKAYQALSLDPFAADPTLMRTLLYFPDESKAFYGEQAIQEFVQNDMEGRLFRSFKTHLHNKNYLGTIVGNRIMPLEQMVGIFLLELKKRAEKVLQQQVHKVVLGRPARYSMDTVADEFAVHRMKKAAEFAGFTEVHFTPEPLAAAFDFKKSLNKEVTILVGDFGGGTSDFTIIKLGPQKFKKDDVLAIEGCPLAGDALDALFMQERLNAHFGAKTKYRLPMSDNILTMPSSISERLDRPAHIVHLKSKESYEFIKNVKKCTLNPESKRCIDQLLTLIDDQLIFEFFEKIEKTKRELSIHEETTFNYEYPGILVHEVFQKLQFEKWATHTREQIFSAVDRSLTSAQLTAADIDLVCLTGGTAKVPFIKNELELRFGKDKLQTQTDASQGHFHSVLSGLVESAEMISNNLIL